MSGSGDYISREAFLEKERSLYCQDCSRRKNSKGKLVYEIGDAPCRACGIGDVLDDVENFPAADVVEVVRCKECKYSKHWYRDKRLCRLWYGEEKPPAPIDVFDDGFCNYGERRADDV